MQKIEFVFRELLYLAIEKNSRKTTQSDLARKLKISLSTVNHALKPLRKMGAVKINPRSLNVVDPKKVLYYWASIRDLEKDIVYKTRVDEPVAGIESQMSDDIVYGAYSAYKFKFKDVPADYSEVYVYGGRDIEKRFPPNEKKPNLFVLKKEGLDYGRTTTIAQTFVDLWNIKEWYARDFLKAFEERINEILE